MTILELQYNSEIIELFQYQEQQILKNYRLRKTQPH